MSEAYIVGIALVLLSLWSVHYDYESNQPSPRLPSRPITIVHTPDEMDAALMCSQAGCRFEEKR